jgi:upstream activation factor subunit UAF30
MVRASKTSSPASAENVVVPAENVVAPVKQVKVSKKKATPPTTETPVEVSTPVVETETKPLVENVITETSGADASLITKIADYGVKVNQHMAIAASLKAEFKLLEKAVLRELKNAQKSSYRKKKSSVNRQPSGFVKPTPISDELAVFLGKPTGIEMARTTVSKEINAYVREKGLQDPNNGRQINPDTSLATLLNLKDTDVLTYFNLQRYLKPHFKKMEVVEATTA